MKQNYYFIPKNTTFPIEPQKVGVSNKTESKGFYEDCKVQDFPLRGKAVYLIVHRRRWIDKDTGDIVIRHWESFSLG